ncbi:hypothetical protein BV22DRAFT_1023459, partial [Leucogyrophana mollusca]
STHNTRIERLWVEVGRHFVRRWKAFFVHLECLHGLDRRNPHHLWLLHFLFLDLINTDCQVFIDEWNHHPISTAGNQSPADMRFLSEVENGVYTKDPFEDVHPDLIARYYGTEGPPLSVDEQDDVDEMRQAVEGEIASDMAANIHHEPVAVPEYSNPFPSADIEDLFYQALADVEASGLLPDSLTFPAFRWNLYSYDSHEDITVGFRKAKTLTIPLPPTVWCHELLDGYMQGFRLCSH